MWKIHKMFDEHQCLRYQKTAWSRMQKNDRSREKERQSQRESETKIMAKYQTEWGTMGGHYESCDGENEDYFASPKHEMTVIWGETFQTPSVAWHFTDHWARRWKRGLGIDASHFTDHSYFTRSAWWLVILSSPFLNSGDGSGSISLTTFPSSSHHL